MRRICVVFVSVLCMLTVVAKDAENVRYSFVVSMENSGTHYLQVEMTCTDQKVDFIDFKMPVWTTGLQGAEPDKKRFK